MTVYSVTTISTNHSGGRRHWSKTRSVYLGNDPYDALSAFRESRQLDRDACPDYPGRKTKIETRELRGDQS